MNGRKLRTSWPGYLSSLRLFGTIPQMTISSASASTTPILDSAVLVRVKKKNLVNTLFGVAMGIPFAVVLIAASNSARDEGNSAANLVWIFYFLSFVPAIIVHELGHLLAGWAVGFRFSSIAIGPVSLKMEYGSLKIRGRRALPAGGYAGMHVDHVRRLRLRLLLFTLAGPTANLLSAAAIAGFLAYLKPTAGSSSLLLAIFLRISVIIGLANFVPFRLGVLYPDGARIAMLLFSRAKSRRWMSLTAIANQTRMGIRPKLWKRTWLNAAGAVRDGSVDDFAGNWAAYIAANDRKDSPVAALHLERCLELVSLLGPSLRDMVALEAAVFTGWFRLNAVTAENWLRQVKKIQALPQLLQIRADTAIRCARKEFVPALARWQDGFAFIEKLPPTALKKSMVEGFEEWRLEILERQHSEPSTADLNFSVQVGANSS